MVAHQNVLVICDRGAMDPSAYIDHASWQRLLAKNNLNAVDMRDNRYNQIVHMVTAADGADKFYSCGNNTARSEGIAQAVEVDKVTRQVRFYYAFLRSRFFSTRRRSGIKFNRAICLYPIELLFCDIPF